ncbi:hypothetical protein K435DRAFT_838410 [Dendrothele bispora CBS 962.96]|uniref:Small ribosomal subunit protein uS15 N-terminal domain-containing protein n=1 Tax=Dendrothele bispora (strain CBS 962.96) TaxID=1314807 RepID=A0A4S8M6A1_DENBC|nr:hypothetical protein K435DRAFT_838410 [Dendrothele bispora CBS 962.96]
MNGNKEGTREAREKKAERNGRSERKTLKEYSRSATVRRLPGQPASAFLKTPLRQATISNQPPWDVYMLPERIFPPLPFLTAAWLKTTPEEIVDQIIKLACKGLIPSQIGVTLRDSYGIPWVCFVPGNKIRRILESHGPLAPLAVRKHLEINRKGKDSKFRLILVESRFHRLARYYKSKQQIPPTFKYDSATASTLIAQVSISRVLEQIRSGEERRRKIVRYR